MTAPTQECQVYEMPKGSFVGIMVDSDRLVKQDDINKPSSFAGLPGVRMMLSAPLPMAEDPEVVDDWHGTLQEAFFHTLSPGVSGLLSMAEPVTTMKPALFEALSPVLKEGRDSSSGDVQRKIQLDLFMCGHGAGNRSVIGHFRFLAVVGDDEQAADLILGRDFLDRNELTCNNRYIFDTHIRAPLRGAPTTTTLAGNSTNTNGAGRTVSQDAIDFDRIIRARIEGTFLYYPREFPESLMPLVESTWQQIVTTWHSQILHSLIQRVVNNEEIEEAEFAQLPADLIKTFYDLVGMFFDAKIREEEEAAAAFAAEEESRDLIMRLPRRESI